MNSHTINPKMLPVLTPSAVAGAREFTMRLGDRATGDRTRLAAERLYARKRAALYRGDFDMETLLCEASAVSRAHPVLGYVGVAVMAAVFGEFYGLLVPALASVFGL